MNDPKPENTAAIAAVCAQWRAKHPECLNWTDVEVIDAMMIRLSVTHPDRVTRTRGADGQLHFKIKHS